MQMSSISNLSLSQAQITDAAKQSQHGDFAALLNRPGTAKAVQMTDKQKAEIRDAAQKLVSSALILPMLAQVRESSLKSDLFHGGFSEDAFGAQLDTELADRMVAKSNFPIVDAIYRKMTGQMNTPIKGQEVNLHG
jgi:creatinine amidohydrolase/Fe(II)-dependent formamide hydrolase-like protein